VSNPSSGYEKHGDFLDAFDAASGTDGGPAPAGGAAGEKYFGGDANPVEGEGKGYARVHRQIDLDEETDRIVVELARDYEGDVGRTLADLLHAHESLTTFVQQFEEGHRDSLLAQAERAERGFSEGRFTTWDEIKSRNNL
jgi:hypothetical protein